MANIGYTIGSTCLCDCCSGSSCTATSVGNITVTLCSSCNNQLCQSTYSSTCVSVNGITISSCSQTQSNSSTQSSNGTQSNSGRTFFEPLYGTLVMVVVSFSTLIYQKIQW